jgi:hypothetical protein
MIVWSAGLVVNSMVTVVTGAPELAGLDGPELAALGGLLLGGTLAGVTLLAGTFDAGFIDAVGELTGALLGYVLAGVD